MQNLFSPSSQLAAYLRDSGGEEQELSVEQQARAVQRWCEERGYILTRVYTDEARPGSSTIGREAFHEMMRHFRNGAEKAGVVIPSES